MSEGVEKGQLAIWAVAALLLLFAGYRLLVGDGEAAGRAPPVRVDSSEAGPSRGSPSGGPWVHVAGAVRRPGLFRLRAGSRVGAALARAGGPLRRADLTRVNLAARVSDGQQIVVPRVGQAPPAQGAAAAEPAAGAAASGAPAAGSDGAAQISLATATLGQLDSIDGIGPALAQRILAYRDEHGGLRSLDQLREVEGIGDKRFEALRKVLAP
jgi:competence protein ComEA